MPLYAAARTAAPRIRAHFAQHIAAARASGLGAHPAEAPDLDTIEAIIDAAFWASLRREEGFVPKISLALAGPHEGNQPLTFEQPLPLSTTALVRVAPAVERPGIHLGVWRSKSGALEVWGATRAIPTFALVLEVAAPGLLVVKHHRGDTGKFVNVAVLEGDLVKVINEEASSVPDCPSLVTSLVGFGRVVADQDPSVLVQLAVSMRAHGRGGSLLVVPTGAVEWMESIVRPIRYNVAPVYGKLGDLVRRTDAEGERRSWQDALENTIDAVAGLTAVDGATIITDQYDLLAFGAKLTRRRGALPVEQVMLTEPIEGSIPEVTHPTRLGGTRHLSAAQFVHEERSALALIASQDGRFTIFAWSQCEELVHAHRVETLLL
ncbi:MAG TPA: hypothetical protein VHZ73_01430 [Vicinamibacterales bacterium]|nr:hypothetical protein [Vicinamibacterales bacterium]